MSKKRIGKYELVQKIGSGSFAVVFEAVHQVTGEKVAIKAIAKNRLNPKLQANLDSEINILKAFDHPNVVKLLDVLRSENHLYLVLEFCEGGDLAGFIQRNGPCSEQLAHHFISQLAEGLKFMGVHNVIHRDLKPQNLLLCGGDDKGDGGLRLKIADFGFARYIKEGNMIRTLCGSPLYMAPEVLRYQQYDAKVDLWAVGVILFELLTGVPPFPARSQEELVEKIQRYDVQWPAASADCIAMLKGLLSPNPAARFSHAQFFASPFLHKPLLPPPSPPASAMLPSVAQSEGRQSGLGLHNMVDILTAQGAFPRSFSDDEGDEHPSHLPQVKTPKTNPFKASEPRPDSAVDESALASLSAQSPLFSLSAFFSGLSPSDLDELRAYAPAAEPHVRCGRLLVDVAESKVAEGGQGPEQAVVVFVKALELFAQAHAALTHALTQASSYAPRVKPSIQELAGFVQGQIAEYSQKAIELAQQLMGPPTNLSETTTCAHVLFCTAVNVGKEAGIDELLGNLTMSFKRYDVVCALLEVVQGLCEDEDQATVGSYLRLFESRKLEVVKRVASEAAGQ